MGLCLPGVVRASRIGKVWFISFEYLNSGIFSGFPQYASWSARAVASPRNASKCDVASEWIRNLALCPRMYCGSGLALGHTRGLCSTRKHSTLRPNPCSIVLASSPPSALSRRKLTSKEKSTAHSNLLRRSPPPPAVVLFAKGSRRLLNATRTGYKVVVVRPYQCRAMLLLLLRCRVPQTVRTETPSRCALGDLWSLCLCFCSTFGTASCYFRGSLLA